MTAILFLTTHKAASTFFRSRVLPRLARQAKLEQIDPFGDAWRASRSHDDIVLDAWAGRTDCILGPVRDPTHIHDPARFDAWKKPLILRDPRDVLTSFYFSAAFSHKQPPPGPLAERMRREREKVLAAAIDDYVLGRAPLMLGRYLDYRDRFAGRPQLRLFRYEQMVTDWPAFSADLEAFLGLDLKPAVWRNMLPSDDEFTVAAEDQGAHKRQIAPGDHRRKLKPQTIATLDAQFAPVLDWLGYARG